MEVAGLLMIRMDVCSTVRRKGAVEHIEAGDKLHVCCGLFCAKNTHETAYHESITDKTNSKVITMNNNTDKFRQILSSYILPLVHNATLEGPCPSTHSTKTVVAFDSGHRIIISIPENNRNHFVLKRNIPFSMEEKNLTQQIVAKVHADKIHKNNTCHFLMCEIVERAIAAHIDQEHASTIYRVIQIYNQWSAETHEGKRIAHTTGIYLAKGKNEEINFFDLKDCSSVKVLGTTPDSLFAIDQGGFVVGVESVTAKQNNYKKDREILAPITLADIAMWTTSRKRIAVKLTNRGEILLFKQKALIFAKRRSYWRCFPHETFLEQLSVENGSQFEQYSKRAVYLTILDLAFSGSGGCLGILQESEREQALACVSPNMLLSSSAPSREAQLLKITVNGRKFFEIPRRLRIELCSIDGAVIIDELGNVLAAGAIIKNSGNHVGGGGRSAAAQTLAAYGFGIKVSSDGYVEIHSTNASPLHFA